MKSHKKILEELNIEKNTKHHNWVYVYSKIFTSMDEAARQAFEAGIRWASTGEFDTKYAIDSETFEYYLKELDDKEM